VAGGEGGAGDAAQRQKQEQGQEQEQIKLFKRAEVVCLFSPYSIPD
jgi:hypothetical protein